MYLFDNELFAIECIAKYAMEGLDVKEGGVHDGYTDEFAHCPYPKPVDQVGRLPGDLGYYLTFFDHQKQGLLQSVDEGRKCYWASDVKKYLDTWPPGCFDLWDIYDKFNKPTEAQKKAHSERMTGENNPNFGNTGALSPCSKAIVVIKPDGTVEHYGSICEAARKLEVPDSHLSTCYLIPGKQPKWGKLKGHQFFYAVKE